MVVMTEFYKLKMRRCAKNFKISEKSQPGPAIEGEVWVCWNILKTKIATIQQKIQILKKVTDRYKLERERMCVLCWNGILLKEEKNAKSERLIELICYLNG